VENTATMGLTPRKQTTNNEQREQGRRRLGVSKYCFKVHKPYNVKLLVIIGKNLEVSNRHPSYIRPNTQSAEPAGHDSRSPSPEPYTCNIAAIKSGQDQILLSDP
jgi:hypothetical protein